MINAEELFNECMEYSREIKNGNIQYLVQIIYREEKEKLLEVLGSVNHHCYPGGLLEHTRNVVRGVMSFINVQESKSIDKDYLIAGALLHDIGKIKIYDKCKNSEEVKVAINKCPLAHELYGASIVYYYGQLIHIDEVILAQLCYIVVAHGCPDKMWENEMVEAYIVNLFDKLDAIDYETNGAGRSVAPGEIYSTSAIEGSFIKSINLTD